MGGFAGAPVVSRSASLDEDLERIEVVVGIAVSLVGTPLAALAAFLIARHLARPLVEPRLPRPVAAAARRLEHGGFGPSCCCGLLGSAVGAAPRVLLYGLLGGAAAQAGPVVLAAGAGVMLLVGLGAVVVRRRRVVTA